MVVDLSKIEVTASEIPLTNGIITKSFFSGYKFFLFSTVGLRSFENLDLLTNI